MPYDLKKYPSNWLTEIRPRILARAGEVRKDGRIEKEARCEWCSVENHAIGIRARFGQPGRFLPKEFTDPEIFETIKEQHGVHEFMIILTIAHLDHDPENFDVSDSRLAAICQKCHLDYDRLARREREEKEQVKLWPMNKLPE